VGHMKIFLQKQKNLLTSFFFFFVNSLCNMDEAAYGHTRVVNAELCGLIRCKAQLDKMAAILKPKSHRLGA
jgi:hypothetical protein